MRETYREAILSSKKGQGGMPIRADDKRAAKKQRSHKTDCASAGRETRSSEKGNVDSRGNVKRRTHLKGGVDGKKKPDEVHSEKNLGLILGKETRPGRKACERKEEEAHDASRRRRCRSYYQKGKGQETAQIRATIAVEEKRERSVS